MTPQNRLSIPQGLALKDLGLNRWTSVIWDGNSVLIASGIKNNSMLSEGWCTLNQIYDAFDFLREQKVYLKSCLNAGKILELVDFSDEIIWSSKDYNVSLALDVALEYLTITKQFARIK